MRKHIHCEMMTHCMHFFIFFFFFKATLVNCESTQPVSDTRVLTGAPAFLLAREHTHVCAKTDGEEKIAEQIRTIVRRILGEETADVVVVVVVVVVWLSVIFCFVFCITVRSYAN